MSLVAGFEQRLERLAGRLSELELWRDQAVTDLDGWHFKGQPFPVGSPWPELLEVLDLQHPPCHIPENWALAATRIELLPGGEGLLRVHCESGDEEAFGVDRWHSRFPPKEPGFALSAELVARQPYGRPAPDPRLLSARLVLVDSVVDDLARRLGLTLEAARALGGEDIGRRLLEAAESAWAAVELPSESGLYLERAAADPALGSIWRPPIRPAHPRPLPEAARASLRRAAGELQAALAELRNLYPAQGRLALSGHGHLDLAWLWPIEETVRKAQRTFATACGLLDRDPEATFSQSSAELYELTREHDPLLFSRIARLVREGRWEPVGGMWVEADQNLPSGESLVRQLLYGQRFFEHHFGCRPRVCWLPDCFGFTPALPQLLRGAGIDWFFTTKLNWSETNRFPYDLWWWEGLDGSRVLAHSFRNSESREEALGDYNGNPRPGPLLATWRAFQGKFVHPESLFTVGYGDGGGGMTEQMLAGVRELAGFPALPGVAFTRVDEFFGRLQAAAKRTELPVWVGEMYLELHRGTLTTQGRIKRRLRSAERDLVAAETAWSLCRLLGGANPPPDLARPWRLLLRNQFHDILPGSATTEVCRAAESELKEVARAAAEAIDSSLDCLAGQVAPPGDQEAVLAVNPDTGTRPLRLELKTSLPGAQPVGQGWVGTDSQPLRGLETATLVGFRAPEPERSARAQGLRLENGLIRAELTSDGRLRSLYDIRTGREVLTETPGNQLWAYSDRPRAWDAWDVDEDYARQGEQLPAPAAIEAVEPGPHRAAIRISWLYRSSRLTQEVRLWANSPRLEFVTHIDWHERRLLLKTRFWLAVRSPRATFETAFGVVERPTHRNTSWDQARFEVAGHRFADLSEPGFGVALLNNGRYGHHVLGNEMGLSLLRSPVYPDPWADEGEHQFTYALLPHQGGWMEGGVLAEAEDLNRPPLVRACKSAGEARRQIVGVTGVPLGLAALKPAEDGGDVVLRLYEPQGTRGKAEISLPEGWRLAEEVSLLEEHLGPPSEEISPFQVRSYRLEPT